MSYQCDVCKELEAREATGIGYICCVCDAEFEIATELEDHISMHTNLVPRACDPWEGNKGSGIIRFREESDWPLKWNA